MICVTCGSSIPTFQCCMQACEAPINKTVLPYTYQDIIKVIEKEIQDLNQQILSCETHMRCYKYFLGLLEQARLVREE